MTDLESLFFINNYEGNLVKLLIRERKKLADLQKRLWSEKNLKMSILKHEYDSELHRLKLIRVMISQLIKTLREDDNSYV